MINAKLLNPLNNANVWAVNPPVQPPVSEERIKDVQEQINSIIGTTRDNQPIALLVWNGDRKYWKKRYIEWDAYGKPTKLVERPIVLDKTIRGDNGERIQDVFPPRWLILTRIEPEQYAETWERDTKIMHPTLKVEVRTQPAEIPPVQWKWYMTVADHDGCEKCYRADSLNIACTGFYAPPEACLPYLREVAKGIANLKDRNPFQKVSEISENLQTENYDDQTLRDFENTRKLIEIAPLTFATAKELEDNVHYSKLKENALERLKRSSGI